MHTTWQFFDILYNFLPITTEVSPPIPASISSKIIVVILSTELIIDFRANIIREISPPEIIFLNGFMLSPRFSEIKNSMSSIPLFPSFTFSEFIVTPLSPFM